MEFAMINWPEMLRQAEDWAAGFWVGTATASLVGIIVPGAAGQGRCRYFPADHEPVRLCAGTAVDHRSGARRAFPALARSKGVAQAAAAPAATVIASCSASWHGSDTNHPLGTRFGGRLATQSGPSAAPAAMPAHAPKLTHTGRMKA